VGIWLEEADWKELDGLLRDAYRLAAPRRLAATLDD
jgi:hypothetical protein